MHNRRSAYLRAARLVGSSRCVHASSLFAARELSGSPRVSVYTLRQNGLKAVIRHPLVDSWVLEEVFRRREYEPPAELREKLESIRPLRVADLGGHVGLFGLFVLGEFPDARVVSFEPDPANLISLRKCVEANELADRWEIVPFAAGTTDGNVNFISGYHLSHVDTQPEAIDAATLTRIFPFLAKSDLLRRGTHPIQVRVVDCFPVIRGADLVKIDIEGGEWPLLDDPRLAEIEAEAVVLECHRASSPIADATGYARDRLEAAGYRLVDVHDASGEAAMIWASRNGSKTPTP